jgi:phosphoribosylcarboxyaminoimidazole (NCAIR) mutase
LLAAAILGLQYPQYRDAVRRFRAAQAAKILAESDPRKASKPAPKRQK